jgi:SAM-dependent methyltransferase
MNGSGGSTARVFSRSEYAKGSEFWDARFEQTKEPFDWYSTYTELRPMFQRHCPPCSGQEVLMVGCGNATLSSDMVSDGYTSIMNIDISAVVINQMKDRYASFPALEWRAMDATNMDFEANRFEIAVDKGTVDALMCDPSNQAPALGVVGEVWRTLQPGGFFVLVTHSPHRMELCNNALPEGEEWEEFEISKGELSQSATMINILRSKLGSRPLVDAWKEPALLAEALKEFKQVMCDRALAQMIRDFQARKRAKAREAGENAVTKRVEPENPGNAKEVSDAQGGAKKSSNAATADLASLAGKLKSLKADENSATAPEVAADSEPSDFVHNPKRQQHCWVYVLRKSC